MTEIRIREAKVDDVEDITQLYYGTVTNVNAKDYSPKEIEVWSGTAHNNNDRWERSVNEQYFLIAEIDKEMVGFSSIAPNGYLDFMYVHKDHQRKGIALMLLNEIESKAIEQKNKEIFAYVLITARPFFEKYGYEHVGYKIITVKGVDFKDNLMIKKL
ncbi:MAG: GNAT family N-acetyltransferase [bacterium]|nr:GNAT family N-acetyltransferase [bacterium]